MPCFSPGPTPGTPEYERWLPKVQQQLDSFKHVVDYYYTKAGLTMPQPNTVEERSEWKAGQDKPSPGMPRLDSDANLQVLHQILLHIDCDDVTFFDLHEMGHLLAEEQTTSAIGYSRVRGHCFRELRNGFHYRPTSAQQWVTCKDPREMLDHVQGKTSDRKLRLFAVACCRRLPEFIPNEHCKAMVEFAEHRAEGTMSENVIKAARSALRTIRKEKGFTEQPAVCTVFLSALKAAQDTALNAHPKRDEGLDQFPQAALVRDIFGNPFRPAAFDAAWRTDTALSLAREMYESRDFSAMPILADALQDAGCDNDDILNHCRDENGVHVRGCWVVDLVLGKE